MNISATTTTRQTTDGTTMQAITQDRYGEAEDVLRLEEIARPAIGDEEVLLRVHAAGVDRGVWHLMTGLPYPVRLAGYGIRAPKTPVRGRESPGGSRRPGRPSRRCTSATRCSASPKAPLPSTPAPGRASWRPSPRTSASRRPRPSPSRR